MAGSLSFGQQAGPKKLNPDRPNAAARADKRDQKQQQRPLAAPVPPGVDIIQGFYITKLRQGTEISEEQFSKVAPLLREYLRERAQIGGPRRMRAENQLFQAVRNNAPEEELARHIQQLDAIDSDVATAKVRFFTAADPSLSVRQRARLRVFMVQMERQVNQMIRAAQGDGAPPQNPAPPVRPNPPGN